MWAKQPIVFLRDFYEDLTQQMQAISLMYLNFCLAVWMSAMCTRPFFCTVVSPIQRVPGTSFPVGVADLELQCA